MSVPYPLERTALRQADSMVTEAASRFSVSDAYAVRLSVLEGVAARLGGFSVVDYQKRFLVTPLLRAQDLESIGARIAACLSTCGIHPSLALSALAREQISSQDRRTTGAHHTDFRLANLVGRKAAAINIDRRPIVDPACGAGILLVATTLAMFGGDRTGIGSWMAGGIVAGDVSEAALRGTRLALASLTDDLAAVEAMSARWSVGDSLLRPFSDWRKPEGGFGVVVANPPWEKVKASRHEQALAAGQRRDYGQSYAPADQSGLLEKRLDMRGYATELASRYPTAASGEMDLYAAFSELMVILAGEKGGIAALLPAGLIRSQGTRALRELLAKRFQTLDLTILDNKARFFSIDTRFKFVVLSAAGKRQGTTGKLLLSHATAISDTVLPTDSVVLPWSSLRSIRPDLTIPEVRSAAEWRLFKKLCTNGQDWSSGGDWDASFAREVDMTNERPHFLPKAIKSAIPIVEGRMVQHCRFGVKSYVSGEGRSAIWRSNPIGSSFLGPQFWISTASVPRIALERSKVNRAGFCDIAGQTNERSMSSAMIPSGVVCGNKVPTVVFACDEDGSKARLWCGLVNSFVFDWMLRRVLTTTVNYFLLQSLPLPPIVPGSLPGRRVVDAVLRIEDLDRSGRNDAAWAIAEQRAIIDGICIRSFNLTAEEVSLILEDFRSLDRSQPALPGERRSTVTRDYLQQSLTGPVAARSRLRIAEYAKLGAVPYVPSQNGEGEERLRAIG